MSCNHISLYFIFLCLFNLKAFGQRKNVLFIIFDDLRPQLSIYGKKYMNTPNFDRLAEKSVLFENAYCAVAVCAPSRISILTGLRPDTSGVYEFQKPNSRSTTLPEYLSKIGYNTAAYGKIFHHKVDGGSSWNVEHYDGGWYGYQTTEHVLMNASVFPDRDTPIENFRDYMFTSKAINALRNLSSGGSPFFLGVGYKLPHTALHVPYKFFEPYYKQRGKLFQTSKAERSYPNLSPVLGYKRSLASKFYYLNETGRFKTEVGVPLEMTPGSIFPLKAHQEIMMAYSAAVSFLDSQLGRLLDTIDKLDLWNDLIVTLTSDHGIHNGEKGIWNKWTLFDESTRVPLLIYHPDSPFTGKRYKHPVELLDVTPTLLELVGVTGRFRIQGKSLVPVILPPTEQPIVSNWWENLFSSSPRRSVVPMPILPKRFALSQMWLCASRGKLDEFSRGADSSYMRSHKNPWQDCKAAQHVSTDEISVMGYSLRLYAARYTMWLHYSRQNCRVITDKPPYAEEFYSHSDAKTSSFAEFEMTNIIDTVDPSRIENLRSGLLKLIAGTSHFKYRC